jgi:hypothetical protein
MANAKTIAKINEIIVKVIYSINILLRAIVYIVSVETNKTFHQAYIINIIL